MGIIYKITNKIDGKKYIGKTTQSLNKRWAVHYSKGSGCTYLYNSICKYGKENFEIKVLAHCNSIEEMNRREVYYIKLFNALAPSGYNLRTGGEGGNHSLETRKKMSESGKGKIISQEQRESISRANLGKIHTAESRLKMSNFQKGRVKTYAHIAKLSESNKGKHWASQETRDKMSRSHKGKKLPLKTCLKMSESRKRPIVCLETSIIYESSKQAALQLNLHRASISKVLNGARKRCGNFTFTFVKI